VCVVEPGSARPPTVDGDRAAVAHATGRGAQVEAVLRFQELEPGLRGRERTWTTRSPGREAVSNTKLCSSDPGTRS
jgi:hypothetical protein